jgi:hypothetical protein
VSFVNYSNCWSLCLFVCLKFDISLFKKKFQSFLFIFFFEIVGPIPDLIVNWNSNILVAWQNCRFHKILITSSCNWRGLSSACVSVSSLICYWIPSFVHGEMEMYIKYYTLNMYSFNCTLNIIQYFFPFSFFFGWVTLYESVSYYYYYYFKLCLVLD